MAERLREFELRLLRCSISNPHESACCKMEFQNGYILDLSHCIVEIITLIEAGQYYHAIRSDSAMMFLAEFSDSSSPPDQFYFELTENHLVKFVECGRDEIEKSYRLFLVFSVSVAAFLCFIQQNITGPAFTFPACPLSLISLEGKGLEDWDSWAHRELISEGSHLVGKLNNIQYIVFAELLAMKIKDIIFKEGSTVSFDGFRSISWWVRRILFVKQRILDGLSSSLFDLLQVHTSETLSHFGCLDDVKSYWGPLLREKEAEDIVSLVYLEAGVVDYAYGYTDICRKRIRAAENVANLELFVTGMLGYRTIYQKEATAIKVLVAKGNSVTCMEGSSPVPGTIGCSTSLTDGVSVPSSSPRSVVDEIYKVPKLDYDCGYSTSSQINKNDNLEAVQQALILAQCLLIDKSSREDELRNWDMAPYIEAIDSQKSSFYSLRCFCNLMRFRWECSRTRTKVRALETISHLVEDFEKEIPEVQHRIPYCFSVFFQIVPSLQKEYGEHLVRCGLIGEAITIFERLNLWDNLIHCNSLLGKKAAAIEVIRRQLSEKPKDPSLWCSLGDVTNDDSCYNKALEVSNDKSVRAKRSLARSAYASGDYKRAQTLWESAMTMNSMYPDGWFALGAAALKAKDVDKAVDAFTRAVQLDPMNGEAWNNIACLHMIRKKSKEACLSFKEALKFKRDSWQMWENYSHVSLDAGDIRQALEACQMVLQLTKFKRVDLILLWKLMEEIQLRTSKIENVNYSNNVHLGGSREVEQLFDLMGKLLQQIVKAGGPADGWGLYARWQKMKGDLTMCSEALLKQVRSYQGSDLWKDGERFKKFSIALVELSEVYMQMFLESRRSRELLSTELLLKNSVKQAQHFCEMEEFKQLEACLAKVQMKIHG